LKRVKREGLKEDIHVTLEDWVLALEAERHEE
jgi:hypothetical protein